MLLIFINRVEQIQFLLLLGFSLIFHLLTPQDLKYINWKFYPSKSNILPVTYRLNIKFYIIRENVLMLDKNIFIIKLK